MREGEEKKRKVVREAENAVIPLEKKLEQDAPPTLRDKEGHLQILICLHDFLLAEVRISEHSSNGAFRYQHSPQGYETDI